MDCLSSTAKRGERMPQQFFYCTGFHHHRVCSIRCSDAVLICRHGTTFSRCSRVTRYKCAEVSFGCRKRSIQYAQPNTIGKRMRSTVTRTWTLGGGAPLKLSNQSAV